MLKDAQGRVVRELRISVTDRCNFRCLYCLPETEAGAQVHRDRRAPAAPRGRPMVYPWMAREQLLSFEEMERVARLAVGLGVQKLRVTGGEPLMRRQIERLIERLANIPGVTDLAMTTNGFAFLEKGRALREAGLRRITFSLDSLDREQFKKITGRDGLEQVLAGIAHAQELGLTPVKLNAVIIRGLNDHELEALAAFGRRPNLSLRFIEFMPLDSARVWQPELVVPGREILERLRARYALEPLPAANPAKTATRWRFADGRGEVGIIAPVSQPFCEHCCRLRLTADGKLRTCLFSQADHDLRPRLRQGASDAELSACLRQVVWRKEPGHRVGHPDFALPNRSMCCIGG